MRYFTGSVYMINDLRIFIIGRQDSDGDVSRSVVIADHEHLIELFQDEAIELSRALNAAAKEVGQHEPVPRRILKDACAQWAKDLGSQEGSDDDVGLDDAALVVIAELERAMIRRYAARKSTPPGPANAGFERCKRCSDLFPASKLHGRLCVWCRQA
jgi:hypothetical protein